MNDVFDMPDDWKIAGHDEVAGVPTEDKGLIITGLGGKGKQFRYFVVIAAFNNIRLKNNFKTEVEKTFELLFSPEKSVVEEIAVEPDHVRFQLLIHMDYSVEEIVMGFINEVNKVKKRLFVHYFVANTAIPDEIDIRQYAGEVRDELTQ